MQTFFFLLFAVVALISACMVVRLRNIMHCALFLLLTLFCAAALFILLQAEFVAAVQVLIYVGAITVLFLFVILLIQVREAERVEPFHGQRWVVGAFWFLLLGEMLYILSRGNFRVSETPGISLPAGSSNVNILGRALLTDYLLPFEVASVLLLAAMIGSVVIAKRRTD